MAGGETRDMCHEAGRWASFGPRLGLGVYRAARPAMAGSPRHRLARLKLFRAWSGATICAAGGAGMTIWAKPNSGASVWATRMEGGALISLIRAPQSVLKDLPHIGGLSCRSPQKQARARPRLLHQMEGRSHRPIWGLRRINWPRDRPPRRNLRRTMMSFLCC